MNPLQVRLAGLRRRLRLVVTLRGLCWLGTLVLLTAALAGWLDWRWHLPGLVRALLLTGALSSAALLVYRGLVRPLWGRTDDLSLALRVEEHFPDLNDHLASAVQFLAQPGGGSAGLREETVRKAVDLAGRHDFGRVV